MKILAAAIWAVVVLILGVYLLYRSHGDPRASRNLQANHLLLAEDLSVGKARSGFAGSYLRIDKKKGDRIVETDLLRTPILPAGKTLVPALVSMKLVRSGTADVGKRGKLCHEPAEEEQAAEEASSDEVTVIAIFCSRLRAADCTALVAGGETTTSGSVRFKETCK